MFRLCPVTLKIYIVQPGLSKAQASAEQLELLSVTETYLMEPYRRTVTSRRSSTFRLRRKESEGW